MHMNLDEPIGYCLSRIIELHKVNNDGELNIEIVWNEAIFGDVPESIE